MNIKYTKSYLLVHLQSAYNKTPSSLAFGIGKDIWQWLLRKMASGNARQYYACDKRQFKYYWETPSPGLPDSNAKPRSPIVVSSNNQCLSRPSEKLSRLCLTSSSEIGLSSVCLLGNHLFFLSLTQLDFKCFTFKNWSLALASQKLSCICLSIYPTMLTQYFNIWNYWFLTQTSRHKCYFMKDHFKFRPRHSLARACVFSCVCNVTAANYGLYSRWDKVFAVVWTKISFLSQNHLSL